MHVARQIFKGGPPKFLDMDYLIGEDPDDVVKFRGDQPRELGDPLGNLKINYKYGTEPNLRPPGSPSSTGTSFYGANRAVKI